MYDINSYHLPLARFTTYGIGGYCLGVIIVKDHFEYIKTLYKLARKVPYRIIGKGSNLLISDDPIDTYVIVSKYRKINIFQDSEKIKVFVTPFTELQIFIKFLIDHGISGYEELAGIPATIGGSIFNNAGIKNIEISKYLKKVTLFYRKNKLIKTLDVDQSFFSYRNSFIKEEVKNKNYIDIISAVFEFPKSNIEKKQNLLNKYIQTWKKRIQTQPIDQKSCGSVFKNLPNIPAWQVISNLGYKGYTIGGAKVSEKHSNFIVNFNNASFKDVYSIISEIKEKSKKQDINLEEEVEIWK